MKITSELNKYCPKCNAYNKHSVNLYKKGKARESAAGTRRYNRKKKGYGSQPKPIQHNQAKTTKKQTLKITCKKCNFTRYMKSIRLRRLEII